MTILVCCADPNLTRRWLEGIEALDSVCCIRDAAEIDSRGGDAAPGIALIDLEAPGIADAGGAAGELCSRWPETSFMFFSARPEAAEGLALLGAGGRGYSNRYIQPALLHRAVELVAMGEVWLGRSLVDHLLRNREKIVPATEIETETKAKASYASLTLREREVARLVANGASNKGVARALGITERTVKAHMSAIFGKTDTRDRLQLGLLARSWPNDAVPMKATGTKVQ